MWHRTTNRAAPPDVPPAGTALHSIGLGRVQRERPESHLAKHRNTVTLCGHEKKKKKKSALFVSLSKHVEGGVAAQKCETNNVSPSKGQFFVAMVTSVLAPVGQPGLDLLRM